MRIIGGSAKGRKLFSPPSGSKAIRPTSDRAREALFNIIGTKVVDSIVLDLYAGTGAFGCEALSRGAAKVFFIDHARISIDLIRNNISLVPGGTEKSTVVKSDLSRGFTQACLTRLEKHRFNLVFADPPYLTELSSKILSALDDSAVLSSDPLIIIEERKNFAPPEKLQKLVLKDSRNYGESTFYFYGSTGSTASKPKNRIIQ